MNEFLYLLWEEFEPTFGKKGIYFSEAVFTNGKGKELELILK
jgi:hypothetical protein